MQKTIKYALSATAFAMLVACGGGGDDGVASVDPQGFWSGTDSNGFDVSAVVLENKEIWGIYSSGSTIYGAVYGSAAVSGSSITVTGTTYDFLSNIATPGTLAGTVVAKSTLTLDDGTGATSLSYSSEYDVPATAAAIAGNWSFIGRSGSYNLVPGSITIDNSGSFTLAQSNCTTSGSIVPRASGKNVYNINLTSAGVGCALGYSSIAGVAYLDTTVTPNVFVSLGLTPDKSDGLIVIGTKQ